MNQADRFGIEQLCQVQQDPAGVQPLVYGWQRSPTLGEARCHVVTRWTFSGGAAIQLFNCLCVWLLAVDFLGWPFFNVSVFFCFALLVCLGLGLCSLAAIIPAICLFVRLMHDVGRSCLLFWINLVPVVGWIIWFVLSILPSEPRTNRYGRVPFFEPFPDAQQNA